MMNLLPRGLIVSCQAVEGEPLFGVSIMAAMARAAEEGGAVAIRADSPAGIAAIRRAVRLPIIGNPIVAEGRFYLPSQVAQALALGAHAVCAGSAIIRPQDITRRFVSQGYGPTSKRA